MVQYNFPFTDTSDDFTCYFVSPPEVNLELSINDPLSPVMKNSLFSFAVEFNLIQLSGSVCLMGFGLGGVVGSAAGAVGLAFGVGLDGVLISAE